MLEKDEGNPFIIHHSQTVFSLKLGQQCSIASSSHVCKLWVTIVIFELIHLFIVSVQAYNPAADSTVGVSIQSDSGKKTKDKKREVAQVVEEEVTVVQTLASKKKSKKDKTPKAEAEAVTPVVEEIIQVKEKSKVCLIFIILLKSTASRNDLHAIAVTKPLLPRRKKLSKHLYCLDCRRGESLRKQLKTYR
jgi:hypothetical protein